MKKLDETLLVTRHELGFPRQIGRDQVAKQGQGLDFFFLTFNLEISIHLRVSKIVDREFGYNFCPVSPNVSIFFFTVHLST